MIDPMHNSILSILLVDIEKEDVNHLDIIKQVYNDISLSIPPLELEQVIFCQFCDKTKTVYENLLNIIKFDSIESSIEILQNACLLLDSFFAPIKYLEESVLEIQNYISFANLLIDLFIHSYQYCKTCSEIYENDMESVSIYISTFYEKTYKLQTTFLILLSKVQISTQASPKEQQYFNTILLKLGKLSEVAVVLDSSIVFEIWKYIMKILKMINFEDETLMKLFNNIYVTFCDCLMKLKEMFVDSSHFQLEKSSKIELRLLKVSCFYWKIFVLIFKMHSKNVITFTQMEEIIATLQLLFTILSSINFEESLNEQVGSLVFYMIDNINLFISQLIQLPQFNSYLLATNIFDDSSFQNFNIRIFILKAIAEVNDDIVKCWMAYSLQLIAFIFNVVKTFKNKLESGNQSFNSYSFTCEVLLKLMLCIIKQKEITKIELILIEALLNDNFYVHIMAVDLWISISRILGKQYTLNLYSHFLNSFPIKSNPDMSFNGILKSNYEDSLFVSKILFFLNHLTSPNQQAFMNQNQVDNQIYSPKSNYVKHNTNNQKAINESNNQNESTKFVVHDQTIGDYVFKENGVSKLKTINSAEDEVLQIAELECSIINASLNRLLSIHHLNAKVIESNRSMLQTFASTLDLLLK